MKLIILNACGKISERQQMEHTDFFNSQTADAMAELEGLRAALEADVNMGHSSSEMAEKCSF